MALGPAPFQSYVGTLVGRAYSRSSSFLSMSNWVS